MSAILEAREADARYPDALQPPIVRRFDLVPTAAKGVERLRELIVRLAIRGRLVPQARVSKKLADPRPSFFEDGESFDIPPGWRWVRLGDLVVSSEAGWSPSCPDMPRVGERWAVLKVSAVSWGKFNPEANKELPPGLSPRPEYEVKPGDFLLSRANTADLVARSVFVGTTPAHLMLSDKTVRLKFASDTNPEFINLVNNSGPARAYYARHASGTSSSMKNVSRAVILGLPIALPPVTEQARIVARVDELMRLCDALEAKGGLEAEQHSRLLSALLGTLTASRSPEELSVNWQRVAANFDLLLDRPEAVDALEHTILHLAVRGALVPQDLGDAPACVFPRQMRRNGPNAQASAKATSPAARSGGKNRSAAFDLPMGWEWARIGDIAQTRLGKMLDKGKNRGRTYPYLRNTNVQWGRFELDDVKFIQLEEWELPEYRLQPGDLLVCEGGEPGRCAVWNDGIREMYFQKALHRVRPTGRVSPHFLAICFEADADAGWLAQFFTGATIKHFVGRELDRYVVPLPPIAEQTRIVARVDQLRRLCAYLRQRLAATQAVQARLADALVESATAA